MSLSSLSEATKRTSDMLKLDASRQVLDYEQRFKVIKGLYEKLLSNLIVARAGWNLVNLNICLLLSC